MSAQDSLQKKVLLALITPIARFCLKHNVGIQTVFELTKQRFLQLAAESIEREGAKVTASRLTVATGLNRREVTRIHRGEEKREPDTYLPRRVLSLWENDLRYSTKGGKPRVLSYEGEDSEFYELVRSISQDVRPAAMLRELERSGLVTFTSRGVKAARGDQSVAGDPLKILEVLSKDSQRLVTSVEQNAYHQSGSRNAHFTTEYDNVLREKIPEIKKHLLNVVSRFHKDMRSYISQYDKDDSKLKGEGKCTVSLTSFSLVELPEKE